VVGLDVGDHGDLGVVVQEGASELVGLHYDVLASASASVDPRLLIVAESARVALIRASYALLGLISFLTAGEDEVRAWTIPRGLTAQKAAGKIHSDIERGFIRAETVGYDDFVKAGGDMNKVKAAGAARLEGKTYEVRDGDIINFKFNV